MEEPKKKVIMISEEDIEESRRRAAQLKKKKHQLKGEDKLENISSLAANATLAVVLMFGFYLFALGIIGVLLFIPYATWVYLGSLPLKIAFFCVVGAGVIFYSILPRPDRFIEPVLFSNRTSTQIFSKQ